MTMRCNSCHGLTCLLLLHIILIIRRLLCFLAAHIYCLHSPVFLFSFLTDPYENVYCYSVKFSVVFFYWRKNKGTVIFKSALRFFFYSSDHQLFQSLVPLFLKILVWETPCLRSLCGPLLKQFGIFSGDPQIFTGARLEPLFYRQQS